MNDGQPDAAQFQINPTRQGGEPAPCLWIDAPIGERVPVRRQPLAGAALRKSAAAIIRAVRQLLVAVAHHDVDAGAAHQIDRLRRRAAVGDKIACADDIARRDPPTPGLVEDGAGSLEVAIGSTKHQNGFTQ